MRAWLVAVGIAGCAAPPTPDYTVIHHREDAPAWSIPYGHEPWLSHSSTEISVDRVRHAIRDLRVEEPAFTASYGERGLALQPAGAAALTLATTRVELGDRALDATGGWSILGNTAQRRWGSVIEHHAVTADGVELAWVLSERVPGPLTVTLATDGLAYAGRTAGGDHFADRNGTPRVRIGAAALVDARGQRWSIEPAYDDGTLRWRVPAEVLARATFPVALDPTVGPELGSDRPVLTTNGERGDPALAWNGSEWLAVWVTAPGAAIHGTRLSSTGEILDPSGIVLDDGTTDVPVLPRVTSNGTDFFVAWNYVEASPNTIIVGVRVSAAGALAGAVLTIGTDGVIQGFADPDDEGVAIASNGVDYTAAWMSFNGVVITHISVAGAVDVETAVNPGPITGRPAIAYNGTNYLVAWQESGSIRGALVGPAGPGTPFTIMPTSLYTTPGVAASGGEFLVAAIDSFLAPAPSSLKGARVSGAGAVLDPTPFLIASDGTGAPNIAATGGTYLVTWSTPSGTCEAARVTSASGVLDATPLAIGLGTTCVVGASDTAFFVARGTDVGIVGGSVSTAGVVAPSARISTLASNVQTAPAVAASTTGFLFAWYDDRANGEIVGTRVTPTGEIQDPDGLVVATAMIGMSPPTIGSNGTDFLVAWTADAQTTDAVYGAHVTTAGVADATPRVIGQSVMQASGIYSGLSSPVISGLNGGFLAAWSDTRDGAAGVYTSLVSATGVAASPMGVALAVGSDGTHVATPGGIATNGTEYMVAWFRPGDGVHVTPVSAAGLRKGQDIAFEADSFDPSIASDGSDFLVVWHSFNTGFVGAARVSAAGANLDPSTIQLGLPGTARVATDGFEYLVVSGTNEIDGTHVLSNGTVFDGVTFPISVQGGAPSVAGRDGLPCLVAYESQGRVTARLISQRCGDAKLDPDEGCDDGNANDHDGCNALCQVEAGFMCFGEPSLCMPSTAALCGGAVLCDPNAICVNTNVGPACVCEAGFTGDGTVCAMSEGGGGGCGCAAKQDARGVLAFALALLVIVRRRRRRPGSPCRARPTLLR